MENLPALHGNWVDLAIILITLFYILGGWGRGFILGIIDLAGFILSFFASLRLYKTLGGIIIDNFSLPSGIANAVGFLLAGLFTEIIFSTIVSVLYKKIYRKSLQVIDDKNKLKLFLRAEKFLGIIPAVGEAFIFTAFILTLLISLPVKGNIKRDILRSRIGGYFIPKTQTIEKELNGIFGQAVNESLTFLTVNSNPSSEEKVDLKFTTSDFKVDEAAENVMLNLMNEERGKAGLNHLSVSFALRDLARAYAKDMFVRGYFSHYNPEGQSPFDRMDKAGIKYTAAGENLALAPSVYLAHQGLMNSPGHRANILSADFSKVGIGAIDGGIYGEMFVQEFTN